MQTFAFLKSEVRMKLRTGRRLRWSTAGSYKLFSTYTSALLFSSI
jgi:hypothetical protein